MLACALDRSLAFSLVLALVAALGTSSCAADPSTEDGEQEDEPTAASEEELRSGVSCTRRSVTGYRSGSPYSMQVVTVGGKPTAQATAHAFLRWQAAADRAGVSLSIRSGFRTMEEQRYLYNCYLTKKCNNGNLAARPGYSNHQNGEALDLATSNWTWVRSNAGRYGFRATVPGERWHYEYSGADPGGICSGDGTAAADTSDEPAEAPAGGGCSSATLGRPLPEGACVQSGSNDLWYQCEQGKWYRGVANGSGPYGRCTSMHPR